MTDVTSKIALVTGAARRIGRAIALDLAGAGYQVALHFNSSNGAAEEVVREIENAGGRAMAFQADLTREAEITALLPRVQESLGPVDLLVNNASSFEPEEWDDVSRASWDLHMEVNLRAPFVFMQAMAEALPAGRSGAVVNIIDQRVWNLTPHYISYTVAKAGLWTLTRTMALALAPRIRVNAIGPGPTLRNERQSEEDFAEQCRGVPLRRATEVGEICAAVRYLAEAPAMTGQMLALDGGEHLGWAQPRNGFTPKE